MIYQLIRRDPAWKAAPWFALGSAVAWACPSPIGPFGALIAIMGLFSGKPHRRASRFEAGLPIEARDLLLARMLSLMAVVWIPALAGAAGIVIVKGFSALAVKPLAVGALCTLMAAVAQAAWLKELAGPPRILYLPFYFFLPVAGPLVVDHSVPLVPPLCTLAGVGLFVWAWAAVPRSFQLSSTGLKAYRAVGQAGRPAPLAAFRWAPVWRSVCSWQYVFVVTMMGLQTLGGQWLWTPFWLLFAWMGSRTKTRWLWALPVGRRALLWTIMGPILAVHVLGYLASLRIHLHAPPVSDLRVVIVTLATILGWVMLTILFCVLLDWRGFARIPRDILTTVFLLFFAICSVACFAALYFARHDAATLARDALAQLGRTAPMGLPALMVAAAAVLIALYWAVEKVFSEPDFADKPRVSQPDAFA